MKIEKIGCSGSDESKDAYFWLTLAAYGERTALVDCAGTTLSYENLLDEPISLPHCREDRLCCWRSTIAFLQSLLTLVLFASDCHA